MKVRYTPRGRAVGGVDSSQTINEQAMTASRSFDQEIVMLRSGID
jgi:hypothetical protein